ncbi:relaxase/mobilization nuclease domain-containing protein [Chryseobacterium indoltheticum]|uniref:Relaxase/Mobilisation nuclease domain n=1 Tax=Chryseobacterium indoltheticum TaxID=254 RepID=A0A381FPT6_9FLAO|nr:relaxase/mobilization nuclease domain-containing protein [Chryseobacterium indoltheticum]SUX48541.1 Relaxase/Mobilisation nuclease domain [Chryseobacterium indoltheticum]
MNNSATTRTITKIALEYNGNDKGTAEMVASNYLLSSTSEGQFLEMKTVADRNMNVRKWALTGYISQPDEIGRKLTDEEFTEIATKALEKIGVTENNQIRLDIHNSTKQKHIHFIVNRIDISGKCTVKSHDVGRRFGEAVREVCKEKGLLTDVKIGIQKKAEMLRNLTETLKIAKNFDELIFKMKAKGFEIQLSKNVKDGVSGMRIVMEKDKNPNTERIYKAGYKLSEVTSKLKIADIKAILNENKEKKLDDETVFSKNPNQENNGNELKNNSIVSEVGKAIEQFLQPTYTSNSDDELLKKKKRKSR